MRVKMNSNHVQNDQTRLPYSTSGHALRFRFIAKAELAVACILTASSIAGTALAQTTNMPNSKAAAPSETAKKNVQKKMVQVGTDTDNKRTARPGARAAKATTLQSDQFAKFENLRIKGLEVNLPGPADSLIQDKGGIRSALAEIGIGYIAWTQNTFVNNLLPNAAKSTIANQLYSGQNPTFYTLNYMMVTYDLSRYGIPDGQIIVGTEQQSWTWQPGGPDRWGINTIAYYQTFLDRKLEFKVGYLMNSYELAGTVVGGNPGANVFGPSSNVLYQGGMNFAPAPTPSLNLTYHFDDRLYNKVSLQRSTSPDGVFAHITANPTGLNWSTANAGILLLDESGYRNRAAPGLPETWLRAGVGFNNSHYTNLAHPTQPRADENSLYYVAADRQLWQSHVHDTASRGIYGGFSVMGAPPDLNKVSQYYEVRLYTVWSGFAVDAAAAKGNLVHRDAKAISGTYTAHLGPGIYASLGLTYIDHPTSITYTPQIGHALNFSASTSIFF
ncbi:carbohydrate porin [Bradyrhizobium huanghuaihaiense]|uniref:carbohydrate porin n=1 Tax=Bradyrhizobium huanghuaihaiense TaxID=990078 RepID=UPI0021AA2D3E|nr:carbohydrate porin [Bradyrhizobium sp. CB3035]UWU75748.1 carbohydrate porin [Bradyrhizobium sp. CB3035]